MISVLHRYPALNIWLDTQLTRRLRECINHVMLYIISKKVIPNVFDASLQRLLLQHVKNTPMAMNGGL